MKYEHELVISRYVGCNPIVINSSLLSAQNRVRNYWTNINQKPVGLFQGMEADIPQPKDKGIFLKDILEFEVGEKYYISEKALQRIFKKDYSQPKINPDKTGALSTRNNSGQLGGDSGTTLVIDVEGYPKKNQNKAGCLTGGAHTDGNHSDMDLIVTHNMLPRSCKNGRGGTGHLSKIDGKSYCLDTNTNTNVIEIGKSNIRRLTEVECERLQTVPDNYTNHVSSTQRYKMLGNGWTVDVVAYIFKYLSHNK